MNLITKKTIVFIFLLQTLFVLAQEPDPVNTGKAFFQDAYKRAYNIEAGVGVQSLLIMEGKASLSEKLNFMPNTIEYYISFPTVSKFENSNTYMAMDFKIGKRMYSATAESPNIVSITNCTSIDFYFLGTSIQFPIKYAIGKHAYWTWSPGVYFDFIIGNNKPEIVNGSLSTHMVIVSHTNEPQNLRPLDIGAALNFEIGVHAAYFGISLREGLRNLAPKNLDMTIRNNGLINIHAGYRFGSAVAKEDQKKVEKYLPK